MNEFTQPFPWLSDEFRLYVEAVLDLDQNSIETKGRYLEEGRRDWQKTKTLRHVNSARRLQIRCFDRLRGFRHSQRVHRNEGRILCFRNDNSPEYGRIPGACRRYGLSRSRLYLMAGEGLVRFVKVGNTILVDLGRYAPIWRTALLPSFANRGPSHAETSLDLRPGKARVVSCCPSSSVVARAAWLESLVDDWLRRRVAAAQGDPWPLQSSGLRRLRSTRRSTLEDDPLRRASE